MKTPPIVPKEDYFSTTEIKNLNTTEENPDTEYWVLAKDYEALLNAYLQELSKKKDY